MIAEHHYDEEFLVSLLEEGESVIARDEHLRDCLSCSTTLQSVRETMDLLRTPDVWDAQQLSSTPNANVLANLRAVQSDMRSEDGVAGEWVGQLLAAPRERWSAIVEAQPEWYTAGVVRKLLAATDRAIETNPPDALEITRIAVDIAETLSATRYGESTVARLRGHAWRERAYALYFTGSYKEAVAAVERSHAAFVECGYSEFDDARSAVVLAIISAEQEKHSEALRAARAAAGLFARYGSRAKTIAARRTEALALFLSRQYHEAIPVYAALAKEELPEIERAHICQNLAACYRELGDLEVAARYLTTAMQTFSKLRMLTHLAKTRWELALLLLAQGRYPNALDLLRLVRDELTALQMAHEVAEVTTDIAHSLVVSNRLSEVADECRKALDYFTSAGLTASAPAMAAISFIRESAMAGRLSEKAVREIRTTIVNQRSAGLRAYAD